MPDVLCYLSYKQLAFCFDYLIKDNNSRPKFVHEKFVNMVNMKSLRKSHFYKEL